MPLARISLPAGRSAKYKEALTEGVLRALVETFNVPKDDQFMVLTEHAPEDLVYNRHYLGIERSDGFVLIQLTVSNTRPLEKKRALYRRIVELLAENPGVRKEDVFINLLEVLPENWSFGNGEAQYVPA
ncbi:MULTISPECIES: tautomerase family protein [unclassified Trinickia]|uniref:tautomerase family protein n=1 Tax=unclassified Trinickia TaxID=2638168 RepID=UPI002405B950|nr:MULTISPECIES: tautomerase family protein [unclassified Trinickia]MDG0027391.1 tautomerase family protein [Trinickia sp. Y13]HVW53978.1 tautomerase family protein [Trinickia sp.]